MSGGAVGVWNIVSKYGDYFSCAVPVSCPGYVNPESYKNVPVRAFVGGASDDYNTYYWSMVGTVNQLKNAGLNATLEVIPGGTHGSTYHTVYSKKDVIEWMLEQ
jgi:predicted peptidase